MQGTLYSDVIESGGGTGAATIKSHHNVGGLPDDLEFELVEPLRALFKDEVRAVGEELGLPERLVWRQPFPGPAWRSGSSAARRRASGSTSSARPTRSSRTRSARPGLYRELWQSFCVLPDIRTVGVQGDSRTYGNVIVIRAVTSDDAMTADWARLPYDLLEQIASRMIGEIRPSAELCSTSPASRPARSSGSALSRVRATIAGDAGAPEVGRSSACAGKPAAPRPSSPRSSVIAGSLQLGAETMTAVATAVGCAV